MQLAAEPLADRVCKSYGHNVIFTVCDRVACAAACKQLRSSAGLATRFNQASKARRQMYVHETQLEDCISSSCDAVSSRPTHAPLSICSYARGVLAGLCELHSAGIAMLDVKPGNVLLADDGAPVLTDFGISRELRDATRFHTSSSHGTPVYMAPEHSV